MIPSGVGSQRPLFGMLSNLPVTTAGVLLQTTQSIHSVMPQIKHEQMYVRHNGVITADLYLCESGKGNHAYISSVQLVHNYIPSL